MQTYISLLRGINVGGHKKIKMVELKELYESLGLTSVITYIQSGNVVFQSDKSDLDQLIRDAIRTQFGFDVSIMIRTLDEFEQATTNNPFKNEQSNRVIIHFLSETPSQENNEELMTKLDSSEELQIIGKELYLHCPNGYGKTKLSNNFIERKLQLTATARNLNTTNKLIQIANGL